jgi:hypothetical protein
MSHAQRDGLCRQIKAQLSGMSWLDSTFSSDSPFGQDFLPETDHCVASLLTRLGIACVLLLGWTVHLHYMCKTSAVCDS